MSKQHKYKQTLKKRASTRNFTAKRKKKKKAAGKIYLPADTSSAYYQPSAGDQSLLTGLSFGNVANINGIISTPEDYNSVLRGPITIAELGSLTITSGSTVIIEDIDDTLAEQSKVVINDYAKTTFESQLSDGAISSGDVLKYEPGGSTLLTKGRLYYLHTDGTWNETDADAASTGKQLLGISLGTNAQKDGMLIRGFVKIPSTEVLNLPGSGASDGLPLYISTTSGHLDFTAPSASEDIVRIVGYCIDDDSSDILLYFKPDNTWVEIA